MNATLSATNARKQFFKLIDETDRPGSTVTITVEGEPRVVMMSVEDFEGWQETLEIMADKTLMKSIRESLKGKRTYTHAEVKKKFTSK